MRQRKGSSLGNAGVWVPDPSDGVKDVLSADPAAPLDDTWWVVRSGSAPTTLSLKVRVSGVTYVLAQMEF